MATVTRMVVVVACPQSPVATLTGRIREVEQRPCRGRVVGEYDRLGLLWRQSCTQRTCWQRANGAVRVHGRGSVGRGAQRRGAVPLVACVGEERCQICGESREEARAKYGEKEGTGSAEYWNVREPLWGVHCSFRHLPAVTAAMLAGGLLRLSQPDRRVVVPSKQCQKDLSVAPALASLASVSHSPGSPRVAAPQSSNMP